MSRNLVPGVPTGQLVDLLGRQARRPPVPRTRRRRERAREQGAAGAGQESPQEHLDHGNIILVSNGPTENEREPDYNERRERGEESPPGRHKAQPRDPGRSRAACDAARNSAAHPRGEDTSGQAVRPARIGFCRGLAMDKKSPFQACPIPSKELMSPRMLQRCQTTRLI